MKLVLTLVVRDEIDVIEENLAYHLAAGVDQFVVTDHRSRDGTTEVLERFARDGVLRLIRKETEHTSQGDWQSHMASVAATELAADWVIPSDADEFWWPRGGSSLGDVLRVVPAEYGVVRALVCNFLPLQDDTGWFAERMTVRLASPAPINDPATPFRPVVKVAHRAHRSVRVSHGGGHSVSGVPGDLLRAYYPLDVLHVPLRSRAQCARKYRKTWTGWEANPRGDIERARRGTSEGRDDAVWGRVALDESGLERGLAEGIVVVDTRLRDALVSLRERGRAITAPGSPDSGVARDTHPFDATVRDEAEVVRLVRRADALAARVRGLEAELGAGRRLAPS